jgi:hypothetical protein
MATVITVGRTFNVVVHQVASDVEGRRRGSLDIDRRRQGEEKDKSDEGFGEHLEN